jgi:hypothetical protein
MLILIGLTLTAAPFLLGLILHSLMTELGAILGLLVSLFYKTGCQERPLIVTGYCVCRVHVVFSLPECALQILFPTGKEIPKYLVYVEWYTPFPEDPNLSSLLFKISPLKDRAGGRICSIIPLANIQRSIHLIPKFGATAPQEWTSSTVLDQASIFYVNSFTDMNMYRIMY